MWLPHNPVCLNEENPTNCSLEQQHQNILAIGIEANNCSFEAVTALTQPWTKPSRNYMMRFDKYQEIERRNSRSDSPNCYNRGENKNKLDLSNSIKHNNETILLCSKSFNLIIDLLTKNPFVLSLYVPFFITN